MRSEKLVRIVCSILFLSVLPFLPAPAALADESAESHQDYLGAYIANFGPFKDTTFTVLARNGRLALYVPGQTVFELAEPDAEGKWRFLIDPNIAVSFDRNEEGRVAGMKLYQAGMTFDLPRGEAAPSEQPPAAAPAAEATPLTMGERLERLVAELELQREKHHIPGMAIAVVKDDEVVLARGFGFADLEAGRPVTTDTVFAIGSSTKAFTALVVGMLVDDGKMSWDDRVTRWLPHFQLRVDSPDEEAEATIRDLLSHRTGFTRMGLLWKGGTATRDEILRTAKQAEPWAPFRKKWFYNNVHYLAAGEAAGKASGSTWDALVEERIFDPLGMDRSSTSIEALEDQDDISAGYDWDEASEDWDVHERRSYDGIAPAGAINSSAMDMARWLRLQLGRGAFEGNRLVSEEQHRETWTPQIEIGGGVSYGMGWLVRDWKGRRVLEHGGNVEGFAAQVALLPDENLGFALMMNVSATQLQSLSQALVWEALAGEGLREAGAIDFTPYLGTYIAAHRSAAMKILEQGGRLAIQIEGQGTFELKPPDDEGVWRFAVTDRVGVSFPEDGSGALNTMIIHEGPALFHCYREGYVPPAEMDLADLEEYLGTWKSWKSGAVIRLIIQNNRLALDWTQRGLILELDPPDAEGLWALRVGDGSVVRFGRDDRGRPEIMSVFKNGSLQDELQRDSGGDATVKEAREDLPSLEEIMAVRLPPRRRAALRKLDTYRMRGSVHFVHSGVKGRVDTFAGGPDRVRVETDLGEFGRSISVVNGDQGWSENLMTGFEDLEGRLLAQARRSHPSSLFGDWREFNDRVEVLRASELDGRAVWILKLHKEGLPPWTVWMDAKTGDTLKQNSVTVMPRGMGMIDMVSRYEDFRVVEGVRIPFRHILNHDALGTMITRLWSLDARTPVPDGLFTLEEGEPWRPRAQAPQPAIPEDPRAGVRRIPK